MKTPFNWTCPYCNCAQVVIKEQQFLESRRFYLDVCKFKECALFFRAIACSNPDCKEVSLTASFSEGEMITSSNGTVHFKTIKVLDEYNLRPTSLAKPQPEFFPEVIVSDYTEACKIRDLSPKASATLSRRVLQGMIRDFCGIHKDSLYLEIKALEEASQAGKAPAGVTSETIEAMHHVRKIGNIGAHMEKDINVIVDVDPAEATTLIALIEMLFKEWYVARKNRENTLARLKAIADQKNVDKKTPQARKEEA